ncbi:hypothetical protein BJ508DRAFT_90181 [Ascobolus immersus RN42]|uniref:Uncharacterized protein n=1 Tax=Ascobolus immersus RN42 TaxID=1160509 RepID=A0A3N4HE79_ASCIM|nr:hypothetical protein BJ508DRAFT_90181 [Ascobolus immersus RN42]
MRKLLFILPFLGILVQAIFGALTVRKPNSNLNSNDVNVATALTERSILKAVAFKLPKPAGKKVNNFKTAYFKDAQLDLTAEGYQNLVPHTSAGSNNTQAPSFISVVWGEGKAKSTTESFGAYCRNHTAPTKNSTRTAEPIIPMTFCDLVVLCVLGNPRAFGEPEKQYAPNATSWIPNVNGYLEADEQIEKECGSRAAGIAANRNGIAYGRMRYPVYAKGKDPIGDWLRDKGQCGKWRAEYDL